MKAYMRRLISIICLLPMLVVGCGKAANKEFVIISGSENKSLEPLLEDFEKEHKVDIVMQYKGSIDIMQELSQAEVPYDAVWPANSLWISLGDTNHKVKQARSIMTSPVVFGIRKSKAEALGFVGNQVRVRDILEAIRTKQLSFLMTSATQSNSGASAYIGFLYALLGNPDMITRDDLHNPQLRTDIEELLGGVNRSSGSSGWLKELFLSGDYDAMVNYEALIIEANQELVKHGKEPLYVVYPVDGIVFADSPLGYLDHGNDKKEDVFKALQTYLLSENIQANILEQGRRTGMGGVMGAVNPKVFNADWGIDTEKILSPIRLPAADVIQEALNLYQTEFRKPSLTVFCLDFSGSMEGEGEQQVKEAMRMLLDQNLARQYLINASSEDVTVVIPFDSAPRTVWQVTGNDPGGLAPLLSDIEGMSAGGGTDIYAPAAQGLTILAQSPLERYIPAIILLTDGQSEGSFGSFSNIWDQMQQDIPVFSIMFGDAKEKQLQELADHTRGRVFDGRHDLVKAFRTAKGYN